MKISIQTILLCASVLLASGANLVKPSGKLLPTSNNTVKVNKTRDCNGWISTHVLDLGLGRPGPGIKCSLFYKGKTDLDWSLISKQVTDDDGRIRQFFTTESNKTFQVGFFQLTFDMCEYYTKQNLTTFFPEVNLNFIVNDACEHYHVPVLASAYGFSSYRGS